MQETIKTRNKVSYHLKDLLKRDVETVQEVCNWLEKHACKPRDIANRTVSKRMLARMIAAQVALKAARDGDVQAAKEVMDRTEGKVADRLELTGSLEHVHRLEAAHARLAGTYNAVTKSLQEIDVKELPEHALEQQSSELGEGEAIEAKDEDEVTG